MKKHVAVILASGLVAFGAQAATFYWDDTIGTLNGASDGGTGAWTVGASGWESGLAAVNWADGNDAVFGGTAGTVTLGGTISALSATFDIANYILDVGANTLTLSNGTSGTQAGSSTIKLNGGKLITNAGSTVASIINLGSSGGILAGGAGNYGTFSGKITGGTAGTSSLTISGGHTILDSTANDFLGNIEITSAHYLKILRSEVIPDSAIIKLTNAGSGFKLQPTSSGTYTETFGGLTGTGYQVWVESSTGLTINGTFKIGSGDISSQFDGKLTTYNGGTSATLAIEKIGTGTFTLGGANNYNGGTTVNGGILQVGTGTGTAGVLPGNALVNVNGTLKFNYGATGVVYGGQLSGTGAVIVTGTNDLQLSGNNSGFTGTLTVDGSNAQLRMRNDNAVSGAALVLANSGAVSVFSYVSDHNLTVGSLASTDATTWVRIGSSNNRGLIVGSNNQSTTFAGVIKNDAGGTGFVTKTGSGTLTLSGVNTYGGSTTIQNGTLALAGGNDRLPTSASVTLGGTGTSGKLALGDGSSTSNQTLAGLTTTGNGGSVVGGNASNSTLTLNIASNNAFGGVLGGAGTNENNLALTKSGNGTLTLSGTHTYTGATSVNAGVLDVTGSLASGSAVALAGSATLKGSGTVGGTVTVATGGIITAGDGTTGTLTLGGLTYNGNGTVNIGTLGNYSSSAAVSITGTLNPNGNTITLNMPTGSANGGTYHLLGTTYDSLTGIALGTAPALTSRQTGGLVATSSYINYVISGVNPYWTGKVSSEWSTATLAEPKNWETAPAVTTDYLATDAVTFDDNATGLTVNIATDVTPTDVIFNNSAKDFTLTGTAGIAGTTGLTKNGTGTVDISSVNSYSGVTAINAGTVKLGSASALGLTAGGTTITSNGVLDLNGQTIGAEALTISGTGISSGGALINSSGTAASLSGDITLGAASSVGGSGNTTLSGAIGGGYALTKVGAGTLTLSGENTYTGGTTLNAGTISLGVAQNGTTSGPLGASGTITLNGGTLQYSASNQTDYSSRFSTAASQQYKVDTNGQTVTWGTALTSSGGSLTKSGAGTLNLSAQNGYNGTTTVNGGTLNLTMAEQYGASRVGSSVVINSGGSLVLNHYFQTGFAYVYAGVAPANITVNAGGTFDKK